MSPLPGKLAICSFCFLIIIGIFSRILPTNAAEIEVNGCIYDPETMYDDQIALFLDECLGRQQVDNPSHVNSAPLSSHNAVQPPIAKEVLPSFHSASSKPDIQGKEQKQTRHPESSTTASSVSSSSGSYVWDDDVSDDDNQDISTDNLSRSSHIPSLRSTIAVLLCALVPLSIYFFWFKKPATEIPVAPTASNQSAEPKHTEWKMLPARRRILKPSHLSRVNGHGAIGPIVKVTASRGIDSKTHQLLQSIQAMLLANNPSRDSERKILFWVLMVFSGLFLTAFTLICSAADVKEVRHGYTALFLSSLWVASSVLSSQPFLMLTGVIAGCLPYLFVFAIIFVAWYLFIDPSLWQHKKWRSLVFSIILFLSCAMAIFFGSALGCGNLFDPTSISRMLEARYHIDNWTCAVHRLSSFIDGINLES